MTQLEENIIKAEIDFLISAAKAAGFEWQTQKLGGGEKLLMVNQGHAFRDETVYVSWNPLRDDRDALQLAAILGIAIQDTSDGTIATCIDVAGTKGEGFIVNGDRAEGQRFAIVECAVSYQRLGGAA